MTTHVLYRQHLSLPFPAKVLIYYEIKPHQYKLVIQHGEPFDIFLIFFRLELAQTYL